MLSVKGTHKTYLESALLLFYECAKGYGLSAKCRLHGVKWLQEARTLPVQVMCFTRQSMIRYSTWTLNRHASQ